MVYKIINVLKTWVHSEHYNRIDRGVHILLGILLADPVDPVHFVARKNYNF